MVRAGAKLRFAVLSVGSYDGRTGPIIINMMGP